MPLLHLLRELERKMRLPAEGGHQVAQVVPHGGLRHHLRGDKNLEHALSKDPLVKNVIYLNDYNKKFLA